MKKILLIFAFVLPLSAAAQGNKYMEIVFMTPQRTINIKVAGVEQTFKLEPLRAQSVTADGKTLERVEISWHHFLPSLKTVKGSVPKGAVGILGRDAFLQSVLTIDTQRGREGMPPEGCILLTSPYKPEWMPLKSRRDITANMPLEELLTKGRVSLDFARGKYYFISFEDLDVALKKMKEDFQIDFSQAPKVVPDGEIEHLTTLDFLKKVADIRNGEEWKFLGDKPCVLDFWAEWCAPCKRMNPGVEALAKEYAGLVRVYKINIDEEPELKEYFKAVAIPMFVFIPRVGAPKAVMGSSIEVVRAEMEALLR